MKDQSNLKMEQRMRDNNRGQVLLLSLLILAGVSAAGIGFATLIINQIKSSQNIDNSITAQYGAESSLERSLYQVKINRLNDTKNLADTITDIKQISESFDLSGLTMSIDQDSVQSIEENKTFSLKKDESEQNDLFDPDAPFGSQASIRYLWISWDNNPCEFLTIGPPNYNDCFGLGEEWVEISWTGWDVDGNSYENVTKTLLSSAYLDWIGDGQNETDCPDPLLYPAVGASKQCGVVDLLDPSIPEIVFYQVRVKALYADVDSIEVKAVDAEDQFVDIPARVHIKTVGKYGRTEQALSASLPWKLPVSGLFDYVIFTKEKLKKTPVSGYSSSGPIEIERGILAGNSSKACASGINVGKICESSADCDGASCVRPTECICQDGVSYPVCSKSSLAAPSGPEPSCGNLGMGPPDSGYPPAVGADSATYPASWLDSEFWWDPLLRCTKRDPADYGEDGTVASGWGNCIIRVEETIPQAQTVVRKKIREEDLPNGSGDYYVSLREKFDSNQNTEEMIITIKDVGGNTTDQFFMKDLYSSQANPAVSSYERCVSSDSFHLEPGYFIEFKHGNDSSDSSNHLDWYQFTNEVPPDIEKKCDYLYNSGRLPIEYNIPESEAALSCSCSDLSCNTVGECKNLGWNPHDFSDSGAPYAECFRYSNTSVFPTGAGEDVWANLPHEWGACRYDENRWSDVVVPGSVSSGNYYLSVRLGFTALDQENLKLEVLDSGGAVKKTFTTNDLWGLEQSPDNSFVECTFSETVALDSNYRLKFSAPNTSLYLDWYQITDTPPGYHPCDGEPIRKES